MPKVENKQTNKDDVAFDAMKVGTRNFESMMHRTCLMIILRYLLVNSLGDALCGWGEKKAYARDDAIVYFFFLLFFPFVYSST